jgi:hypothetical protein
MAFTENLSDFINPDTPGYVVATVGGNEVDAIFDNVFLEVGIGVNGSVPFLVVATADVVGVTRSSAVVVNAINYTIKNIEPDGTGITRLELLEA